MNTCSRIGLVWAGCLVMLIVLGCAHHAANQAPAKTAAAAPRADGLVVAGKFRSVVIEDMDGDGHLDVVGGASSPGMVTISYGDGRGAVSEPQILPVHGEVLAVAVADFNGDSLNDIVFSVQQETTGIRLWLNQSNRQWQQQNGPVKMGVYLNMTTADVNGDGHMDIIAANSEEDDRAGIQVWLGNGSGGWIAESGPTTFGRYMDVVVAELNGDGAPDLIGAGWGTYGAVRVWFGDGNGKWTSTNPVIPGSYYGVSVGDVNADGHLDILAAAYKTGLSIILGDGQGGFTSASRSNPAFRGHKSLWNAAFVDLDGDNRLDIVSSSPHSKGLLAWRNKGNLNWESFEGQFPSTGIYYGLALADLNADGHLDICAAGYGEGIQIWPGNTGAGIKSRRMEIEQLPAADRLAALAAPIENDVFTTINGAAIYKIGPGDVLEITHWEGTTAKKEEILVRPDGNISFRFVEDVPVSGLTASQLDVRLTQQLRQYLRKPRIDVVVKEHKSKTVTVLGAVQHRGNAQSGPGEYKLFGKTTLIKLLTRAGGPAESANLYSVNIRRKSGEFISLDLFEAIHRGDPGTDFILDDGDVVFIPAISESDNRVYVFGEVKEPGTYAFQQSGMRLIDAISEAGGPTVFASESETRVVRGDITRPEIITADVKKLVRKGDHSQNIALASGDLVYVPRSGFGSINVFAKRIRPLLELILWPARVVNDWDRAYDVITNTEE